MDRAIPDAVNLADAKDRLRAAAAATAAAPLAWVRKHPARSLVAVGFTGLLVGASPRLRRAVTETLVLLLLRMR